MTGIDEKELRAGLDELADKLGKESHEVLAAVRDLPPRPTKEFADEDDAETIAAHEHGGEPLEEREQESRAGFIRSNSLSIFFLVIFLAALAGQSYAGWREYNFDQERVHEESGISYTRYITTSQFANAVTENWQSEYLQFVLYFMATIWFVQRGSPESKKWSARGRQSEREQDLGDYARPDSPGLAKSHGGFARALYSNSLLLVMGAIWLTSWFAQSVSGWSEYNSELLGHGENGTNWVGYLGTAHFWEATLQNWQSEFLAVGSMAIFAVYLRQRGSPESKPVGAPHDETASTG